jgi:hypothetical protein
MKILLAEWYMFKVCLTVSVLVITCFSPPTPPKKKKKLLPKLSQKFICHIKTKVPKNKHLLLSV